MRPDDVRAVAEGRSFRLLWRLALDLTPLTLVVLVLLVGLY